MHTRVLYSTHWVGQREMIGKEEMYRVYGVGTSQNSTFFPV